MFFKVNFQFFGRSHSSLRAFVNPFFLFAMIVGFSTPNPAEAELARVPYIGEIHIIGDNGVFTLLNESGPVYMVVPSHLRLWGVDASSGDLKQFSDIGRISCRPVGKVETNYSGNTVIVRCHSIVQKNTDNRRVDIGRAISGFEDGKEICSETGGQYGTCSKPLTIFKTQN